MSDNISPPPKSVLCVCLGNICRSPTAEVILRQQAKQQGFSLLVDSAGTGSWHIGEAPDKRSQRHAKQRGYGDEMCTLTARQIQLDDFFKFDLILAMDKQNLADLQTMLQKITSSQQQKIADLALFSQFDPIFPAQAVPDPYYGNDSDFQRVIDQIESSTLAWLQRWQDNH